MTLGSEYIQIIYFIFDLFDTVVEITDETQIVTVKTSVSQQILLRPCVTVLDLRLFYLLSNSMHNVAQQPSRELSEHHPGKI